MDLSVFLEITKFLSRETKYAVWYSMFKIFEDMSTVFSFSDEKVDSLKVFFLTKIFSAHVYARAGVCVFKEYFVIIL